MEKEYINIGTIKDNRFIETESIIKLLESDLDMFNREKENIKLEEGFNENNDVYNSILGAIAYIDDLKERLLNLIK